MKDGNDPAVRTLTYTAGEEDAGRTVKDILRGHFGLVAHDISRAKYRKDGICVNGRRTYVTTPLAPGDELVVRIEDAPIREVAIGGGEVVILYEDEDLLAADKPAGVVVHPSHGHFADSLGNAVAAHYQSRGEAHDIRTIGRLDKDTSGIMLYGKTRSAVYLLNRQSRDGLFYKTYLALVSGHLDEPAGTFDGPIGRVPGEKLRREVRPDGDPAVTHYEVLGEYRLPCGNETATLVRVRLETGRTHQIRVHFSDAGHPLIGDGLYGGPLIGEDGGDRIGRACLHCAEVTFRKVFTGEPVTLKAPLPPDMAVCLSGGPV